VGAVTSPSLTPEAACEAEAAAAGGLFADFLLAGLRFAGCGAAAFFLAAARFGFEAGFFEVERFLTRVVFAAMSSELIHPRGG
jgi:hypothetical protein